MFTPPLSQSARNEQQHLYSHSQQLIGKGLRDEAIAVLERLVKVNPDHALALNDLGVLYFHQGQRETALTLLERSVQLDRGNATARKNLDILYQARGGCVVIESRERERISCTIF
jgi:Flp pilus assembly protein TadD